MSVFDLIRDARRPEDIFGLDPDKVQVEYRRLAPLCHPDTTTGDPGEATVVFAKLSALHDAAVMAVAAGTYGSTKPTTGEVRSKNHLYRVYDMVDKTGPAVTYNAGYDDSGVDVPCVLRIAGSPKNNDLLRVEIDALKALNGGSAVPPFFPKMIDSFTYRQPDRTQRTAVVTEPLVGFRPLSDVVEAYPNGIDARDMAWMWRRVLTALGIAHQAGWTHNALDVHRIVIHPELHGVMLVDWTAASKLPDGRTKYVATDRGNYPPRVLNKEPATPGDDIWMAAAAMSRILDPARTPSQIAAFLTGCQLQAQPQDAWGLLDEFDDLIGRLWGARVFRPFHI